MVVALIVLDRVDETERQRPAGVLGDLEQPRNRLPPAKKNPVPERLLDTLFGQGVGVNNRGVIAD